MQKYSKEQFWKLYEKLPQELRDALWAEDTGDTIYEITARYKASAHLERVVQLVAQVLSGLLLPQDLRASLEQLGIKSDSAKGIAQELNRFVFYPVKPALEQLHQMEIKVTAKVVTPGPGEEREEQSPEKPSGPDHYREEIK